MLTLLFDIDGTLVRAGGAGLMAMRQAMVELHGIEQMPRVTVHGRTDHGIVSDIFEPLPIKVEDVRAAFTNRYCELLAETLPRCEGYVLPNVIELLDYLSVQEDVSLGLLTGNMKRASDAKLIHFKLDRYFQYGGFGDHHPNRNDVAAVAKEAAANHLQDRFEDDNVWVIGDTVNDVTCARSIGAKVIAVETGGGSRDELTAVDPDLIFETLPEPDAFLADIRGEVVKSLGWKVSFGLSLSIFTDSLSQSVAPLWPLKNHFLLKACSRQSPPERRLAKFRSEWGNSSRDRGLRAESR